MSGRARPLAGRRVVVTRPRHQAAALSAPLRELGAEVLEAPAIRIERPRELGPLDEALARLDRYDWIVFTSVNGVDAFFDRLEALAPSPTVPEAVSFAAIGPATAEALEARGRAPSIVPDHFVAEEFFRALDEAGPIRGRRFLLPRADIAREALPRLLEGSGADVDVVVAYRTVSESIASAGVLERASRGELDVVTFTSASTVRGFFEGFDAGALRGKIAAASIGPITSAALVELGFPPDIEAETYTIPGLVAAIVRRYAQS